MATWVPRGQWAYRCVVATVTTQQAPKRAPKTGRFSNSVVKKAVMAVTGIVMILYLIAHMIGNLHAFQGADEFNEYSHWIRTIGEPAVPEQTVLYIIRLVLLVSVPAGFTVPKVRSRMCQMMNSSRMTPPQRTVREAKLCCTRFLVT